MYRIMHTYVWVLGLVFLMALAGGSVYAWNALVPLSSAPESTTVTTFQPREKIIGHSVQGREISAYTFGNGSTRLLFVGGIHGGYEWNSVLLAYRIMDHLEAIPSAVPEELSVTVIPNLNPDGVFKIVGKNEKFKEADIPSGDLSSGRFNANGVDLNRNFDCKWQSKGTWKGQSVSAGVDVFSEPESKAMRDFISELRPAAAVFWHSKAGAVYASECEKGILPVTLDIMQTYADASGYDAVRSFDAYPVTGDAEGWLASIGVPAVSVELRTHESIEWERNVAGVRALFDYFKIGR